MVWFMVWVRQSKLYEKIDTVDIKGLDKIKLRFRISIWLRMWLKFVFTAIALG